METFWWAKAHSVCYNEDLPNPWIDLVALLEKVTIVQLLLKFFVAFELFKTLSLLTKFFWHPRLIVLIYWFFPVWDLSKLEKGNFFVDLNRLLHSLPMILPLGEVVWSHCSVNCWKSMHFFWGWRVGLISTKRCTPSRHVLPFRGHLNFIPLDQSTLSSWFSYSSEPHGLSCLVCLPSIKMYIIIWGKLDQSWIGKVRCLGLSHHPNRLQRIELFSSGGGGTIAKVNFGFYGEIGSTYCAFFWFAYNYDYFLSPTLSFVHWICKNLHLRYSALF